MTAGRSIDYDALTQDALRGIVRTVLEQVAKTGLPGDHHFYIAFDTQAPGVSLSRRLKEKYPDEMMIVLQHRFWDLAVTEEGFEVKLTFDGIPERLVIPFQSMRVFFDPSVRFTLQFGDTGREQEDGREAGTRRRRREGTSDGEGRRSSELRNRQKGAAAARSERDGEDEEAAALGTAATQPAKPAGQIAPAPVSSPRPVEAFPRPVPVPSAPAPVPVAPAASTKPATPASDEPAPAQQSGAKVFSLDQFRKK